MISAAGIKILEKVNIERHKWSAIKIHFISIFTIFLIAYISKSPVIALLFGGTITFAVYLWIGFHESKKTPLFFNPISYYFLWYSVGLGLSAIYFGILVESGERIVFSTATLSYDSLTKGYLIFLVGSFFLHLGLQKFRPRKIETDPKPTIRFNFKTILFLIIISIIYIDFKQQLMILGGVISFLDYGLIAALSALALAPPGKLKMKKDIHLFLVVIGCVAVFLLNISTTSKFFMMLAFLPLFWYLLIDKRKIKFLIILIIIAIPFYMYFVYPVSYEMRGQYWRGEGINKTKAFKKVLSEEREDIKAGMEDNPFTAYLSRTFDPIAVSYINQQVELYGYTWGETMLYIAYGFIPRIIWPDKPVVTQGAWFAYYTGFAESPEKATVSIGITAVGELFWNFGIAGVVVGMFIIGALFGGLWQIAGNDPRESLLSMLLYLNILFFLTGMAEAVTVLIGVVILFLTFKTLFKLRELFVKK